MNVSARALWLIGKSIAFLVGLGLILSTLNYVLMPSQGTLDAWAALREVRDQVDVLVLGSSHAHCTVLPMEMWRTAGVTAMDVTAGGQDLRVTEAYLDEALKTQKPKVVLLDVHMMVTRTVFDDLARAHSNIDPMPTGLGKYASIVTTIKPGRWFEFFFPLQVYHSRWSDLSAIDISPAKRSSFAFTRGALYLPVAQPQSGQVTTQSVSPSAYRANLQVVRRIARRCESEGARLVLFQAPGWVDEQVDGVPLLGQLKADLSPTDPRVAFLDLNPVAASIGVQASTDYKDNNHLSASGAVKVSRWLGPYLARTYALPDHRQDPLAAGWNADLVKYDQWFKTK